MRSPVSGHALTPDTPHSLSDGAGGRWPVVDGIPYLRVGREALVAQTLAALDAGRADDALVLLLSDQDDWWTGPATDASELRQLVRERDTLTLRAAMALLRFGPVADYFAYRWSDPTYLAGLALIEAHWNAPATAFELACGIGHFLRELTRRGVACVGADVVFAKCWLAKHWVAPEAEYVVFDARHPWPTGDARHDLVMCHDAFYFLPEQKRVAQQMRGLLTERGVLAVSHLHNADYIGGSKGPARPLAEWHALFPNAVAYDEAALLRALVAAGTPARGWHEDEAVEAISLIEGVASLRPVLDGLSMPGASASFQRNPLIDDDGFVHWPSELYREEYANGCVWATADADADPLPFAQASAESASIVAYDDAATMLGGTECDVLYVATPNDRHDAPVLAALAAGVPVLCEKPMAASLAAAEAMAAAVERSGTLYGTAFDQRHHPAHRTIAQTIAEGAIGRPVAVRIVYACWVGPDWGDTENWRADPQAAGGGATIDLALHGLDLAQLLIGEPVERLAIALQRRIHDYPVDDGGMLHGRTISGVLFQSHVAYNCAEVLPRRRLEILGETGLIVALDTMGQTAGGQVSIRCGRTGDERPLPFDAATSPFTAQAAAFAEAVGGAPHDFSAARDLALMRTFAAAHDAARKEVGAWL